jgi:hypothetical protein
MTFMPRYDKKNAFTKLPSRASKRGRDVSPIPANPPVAIPMSYGPPIGGLMLFDDISAVPDGGAMVLDNAFCEADVVRIRGGLQSRNTGIVNKIKAFLTYISGINARAFALVENGATTAIYDVTGSGVVGAAVVSGLVSSVWSYVQFATSGGVFLRVFAKGNTPQNYNGTTWVTTPAITGVTVTSLAQAWSHGNRLFMTEADTTNIWYLAIDSIGGVATKFPLGGLFKNGGSVVAGTSWTSDSAQGGPNVACAIITSEGEVAVYQGPDPATWTLQGVYQISKPCGINCFMKTGGDVLVMTEDGAFALSQVTSLDRAAAMAQAVSKNVRPLWRAAADSTEKTEWQIVRRDSTGMAIVCIPKTSGQAAFQMVVNLQTGAWCRWTGWDASAMATFQNQLLVGDNSGGIGLGESSGADLGRPYTFICVLPFRTSGLKRVIANLMRIKLRSTGVVSAYVQALFDYRIDIPASPAAGNVGSGLARWGTAIWGQSTWAGPKTSQGEWQSVSGIGGSVAPLFMLTMGQATTPDVDFARIDMSMREGSVL